jgi:hypothetical protein
MVLGGEQGVWARAGRREKMMKRGERPYARWGWLAVFVTPAIVSGTAKMRPAHSLANGTVR